MSSFRSFVGVDQTGAVLDGGKRCKPLPTVVAVETGKNQWKFITRTKKNKPLTLKRLTLGDIEESLHTIKAPSPDGNTALMVDCVLGLPYEVGCRLDIWQLVQQTQTMASSLFGRKQAHTFFARFLSAKKIPTRTCERFARANSVFQTHPFQKNIQTGTFRLWRDLSTESQQWLNVWPFQKKAEGDDRLPWLFEGYPSFFWKLFLGSKKRDPSHLKQLCSSIKDVQIEVDSWKVVERNPDWADAFVLALSGVILQKRRRLFEPFRGFAQWAVPKREGWIAGVAPDRF